MNSMPIVRFGFYTTSVGLLFCFPTLTIIEYKIIYLFFFFCLFDILINSQADIKLMKPGAYARDWTGMLGRVVSLKE